MNDRVEISCGYCDKLFFPRTGKTRFCDERCRRRAYSDKIKANKKCEVCGDALLNKGRTCDGCRGVLSRPEKPFSTLKTDAARRTRLKKEQEYRHCESCGLTEWCGESVPLEMDHIDGNPQNNDRANFRLICPNCHSLTPTHTGRNMGKNGDTPRAEKLKKYGSYRIKETECLDCGVPITKRSTRCRRCTSQLQETKIDWPPTSWLIERLNNGSNYLALARELGVTDNAIRSRIAYHPDE